MTRTDPPENADELATLRGFLDYQRETFRRKSSGLSREQLATPHPPSTLTLAGLTKHLALQEDWWLGVVLTGRGHTSPFAGVDFDADPEWEFRTAVDDAPEDLVALWDRTIAASDATLSGLTPDAVSAKRNTDTGAGTSLRWILVHLIEEYARHNGHADLIRESLDGATGE
jgi:Protein of unknown function (DUF664)